MKANIVSLAMMIGVYIVAYILDGLGELAENIVKETWNFQLLGWLKLSFYLIFAGTITTIAFLIVKQSRGNRIISYIFMVSGLLVLILASPIFIRISWRFPLGPMVTQASAFIAIIGFMCSFSQR